MNALEARAQSLDRHKSLWLKLSIETRKAIEQTVNNGLMSCYLSELNPLEVPRLRILGYKVRDIIEDVVEISW